jgi:hypothetical protein
MISWRDYCESKGYNLVLELGLEFKVGFWERTAQDLRDGYLGFLFEEYINDLDGRAILDDLLTRFPSEFAEAQVQRIKEADRVFLDSTVPLDHAVGNKGTDDREAVGWWYFRWPKKHDSSWSNIPRDASRSQN